METFAPARGLEADPGFAAARRRALAKLVTDDVDEPLRDLVADFARLDFCYTLQCCFGHFVHRGQSDPHGLAPPPEGDPGPITYRIAYLALCVEAKDAGAVLLAELARIPEIDREYVQFGSPEWFRDRQRNAYALQVEPARFANRDVAVIDAAEARHVGAVRDRFFARLRGLVESHQRSAGRG